MWSSSGLQSQIQSQVGGWTPPLLPIIVNNKEHYKVETIQNSCIFHCKLKYQVKWKGCGYEDSSWEPAEGVRAPLHIKEFYDRCLNAPKLV